jgi:hypothetical protein
MAGVGGLPEMSRDIEITITITQQGAADALAALEKADKSAAHAKRLKARLISYHGTGDAMLDALRGAVIPYALVNPGGHAERILRKRDMLTEEITRGYDFRTGSN